MLAAVLEIGGSSFDSDGGSRTGDHGSCALCRLSASGEKGGPSIILLVGEGIRRRRRGT